MLELGPGPFYSHSPFLLPQASLPRQRNPFFLGASEQGVGLTAMQVPAWADLLVDWTTMAWSFFSCSKRDLSGMGSLG